MTIDKGDLVRSSSMEHADPAYRKIAARLAELIYAGKLPVGFVMLESPIAEHFGVSRVTIRAALEELRKDGLIAKFAGRGFVVDPQKEEPSPLRLDFFGIAPSRDQRDTAPERTFAWETIAQQLSSTIAKLLPFGAYQISEAKLCAEFGVSRTVVREALLYLRARGLIDKTAKSGWSFGPITGHSIVEQYKMRAILEPEALRQAALHIPRHHFQSAAEKITRIISREVPISMATFEWLERSLHVEMLADCQNQTLYATILENQLPLELNQTFRRVCGFSCEDPALQEHLEIVRHLAEGNLEDAAIALQRHLRLSQPRMISRLKVMAVLAEPKLPKYLQRAD